MTAKAANEKTATGYPTSGSSRVADAPSSHDKPLQTIGSIFAYSSWIWKPEFRYRELSVGVVLGFSRQLYQGSQDDYGTTSRPGRVATIVPDQSVGVLGCIYRLSGRHMESDLAGLDAKQMLRGYRRGELSVENCATGRAETCWVYIARQEHENPYWLGRAEHREIASQVAQASGSQGRNLDYVRRLVEFVRLQTRGVIDRDLDTRRVLKLAMDSGGAAAAHLHEGTTAAGQRSHGPQHRDEPSTVFLVREEMKCQMVAGGSDFQRQHQKLSTNHRSASSTDIRDATERGRRDKQREKQDKKQDKRQDKKKDKKKDKKQDKK